MITEDYVSFETAKLLKEKGFGEKCRTYYKVFPESRIAAIYHSSENRGVSEDDPNEILCPTLQMAMKWLREVHKLFIQIRIIPHTTITIEQKYYLFTIHKDRRTLAFRKDFPIECYFTYEEACEAAIKYCLENLINKKEGNT